MDNTKLDQLVYDSVFGPEEQRGQKRLEIYQTVVTAGVVPASINDFYLARGAGKLLSDFTVPAVNIRGLTYDVARGIFATAVKLKVGAMIFELARSEMSYTQQEPGEYATVIMAAAVAEGWSGPLFLQCDHFQAKAKGVGGSTGAGGGVTTDGVPEDGEIEAIKKLVKQALAAGMYNVDIDMSTLVDLAQPTVVSQQAPNIHYTLELATYVRQLETELGLGSTTVSLGCEIGHIGGRNSTLEDFQAFMGGFLAGLPQGMTGVSKMSIQTGTSHGGVVLPDGSLQKVAVDFELLKQVSQAAREQFGFGGAVQHGASTLPDEMLHLFPESQTLEIHFATGIQSMIMDSGVFPQSLLSEIYSWIDLSMAGERQPDETDQQFHYKHRKKAWGQFKQKIWDMPVDARGKIKELVSRRFEMLFEKLNVVGSAELVGEFVRPELIEKTAEKFEGAKSNQIVGIEVGSSDKLAD